MVTGVGAGAAGPGARGGTPGGALGGVGQGGGPLGGLGWGLENLAQNTRWRFEGLAQNLGQVAQNYLAGGRVLAQKWGGARGGAGGVAHPSPFRAYSMGDTVSKQTPSGLKSDPVPFDSACWRRRKAFHWVCTLRWCLGGLPAVRLQCCVTIALSAAPRRQGP